MQEYLDDEISAEHEKELRGHLQHCMECQNYFHEIKRAIALVQSTSHIQAPLNFTENVMAKLPKEKRKVRAHRWLRQHPVIAAAVVFILLMTGSIFSTWNEDNQFSVSKHSNLVVQNDTVIVPKGETVKGDIIVRNGKIKIEGKVDGDVTVINGENYMASAGNVTGDIKEINELFEWLWYYIKKTSIDVINVFDSDKTESN